MTKAVHRVKNDWKPGWFWRHGWSILFSVMF